MQVITSTTSGLSTPAAIVAAMGAMVWLVGLLIAAFHLNAKSNTLQDTLGKAMAILWCASPLLILAILIAIKK